LFVILTLNNITSPSVKVVDAAIVIEAVDAVNVIEAVDVVDAGGEIVDTGGEIVDANILSLH